MWSCMPWFLLTICLCGPKILEVLLFLGCVVKLGYSLITFDRLFLISFQAEALRLGIHESSSWQNQCCSWDFPKQTPSLRGGWGWWLVLDVFLWDPCRQCRKIKTENLD